MARVPLDPAGLLSYQPKQDRMALNFYTTEDKLLLAVDCIIFGFDKQNLKILLIKRQFEPEQGKWSLIGGFMRKDENLDEAANRVLHTLTGLHDIYMEQLNAYSDVNRDPGQRTVSVAYYALIDVESHSFDGIQLDSAEWFEMDTRPKLIFDHEDMVDKAISRLQRRARTMPIGFELLPDKFTMRQLQTLYESILGVPLDKRNFINKFKSLDVLVKLDETDMTVARKGAFLYRFDKEKYDRKVLDGFDFKI